MAAEWRWLAYSVVQNYTRSLLARIIHRTSRCAVGEYRALPGLAFGPGRVHAPVYE